MQPRGHLTCRQRKQAPSRTVLDIIAGIQRVLDHGCSVQDVAQARAELAALDRPRQPQLDLKVRR